MQVANEQENITLQTFICAPPKHRSDIVFYDFCHMVLACYLYMPACIMYSIVQCKYQIIQT